MSFSPWPLISSSWAGRLVCPLPLQLFSESLEEVGRLDPEAKIEVKAKKSNLPNLLHTGWSL